MQIGVSNISAEGLHFSAFHLIYEQITVGQEMCSRFNNLELQIISEFVNLEGHNKLYNT